MKTFEVETSLVFTLPVAYFARIIDFRSYVDATMSLYRITYNFEHVLLAGIPFLCLECYICTGYLV